MTLNPDVRLRLAPELRVKCNSGAEFTLELGQTSVTGGPHTLAILDAFRVPCTMSSALSRFQSTVTGIHDWMELTALVVNLHRTGMLLDEQAWGRSTTLEGSGQSFGSAPIHIAMLNDRERTSRYLEAIRATVRPGDVVVDLGTGSGVMAVAAAQAGASRVYAIEATGIAKAAQRIFEANGVADRVSLIEGYSTRVELPEPADVLIAEIIGNQPLSERILECTADAVRRLVKPGARLIPSRLRVMAVPVEVPGNVRDSVMVSPAMLADWKRAYSVDFSPLTSLAKESLPTISKRQTTVANWNRLAAPQPVSDFDLSQSIHAKPDVQAEFRICRDGRIDGFVVWFEASLSAEIILSTDPASPRPDNHWMHPVHLLAEPLTVQCADVIRMRLEGGDTPRLHVSASRDPA